MRGKILVLGLTFGVLVGCYHRPYGRYQYGYYGQQPTYSTTYGQPQAQPVQQPEGAVQGTEQAQPVGQPQGVQVTATATVSGEGIAGSDGTRGWRVVVGSPQQEFQRLAQVAAQANCQVESSTASELKAVCNGNVHIVVRFDQQHVYKLCGPNTDPNVCAQVWSGFGG